jgi:hypothetical protein
MVIPKGFPERGVYAASIYDNPHTQIFLKLKTLEAKRTEVRASISTRRGDLNAVARRRVDNDNHNQILEGNILRLFQFGTVWKRIEFCVQVGQNDAFLHFGGRLHKAQKSLRWTTVN